MDIGFEEGNKGNTSLKMLMTEEVSGDDGLRGGEEGSEDCVDHHEDVDVQPQRTPQKRQRQADSSKFNRSNRKSKNCAIFYFKHLDTDGENNQKGFSSQNESDCAFKSSEEQSSEDEWIFTNNTSMDNEEESKDDYCDTDKLMTTSIESVLERVCSNVDATTMELTGVTELDASVTTSITATNSIIVNNKTSVNQSNNNKNFHNNHASRNSNPPVVVIEVGVLTGVLCLLYFPPSPLLLGFTTFTPIRFLVR